MTYMNTKKVVLVKDEMPWVFMIDAAEPWTIEPHIDPRNKVIEVPESLFLDYTLALEMLNKIYERLMRTWAKGNK